MKSILRSIILLNCSLFLASCVINESSFADYPGNGGYYSGYSNDYSSNYSRPHHRKRDKRYHSKYKHPRNRGYGSRGQIEMPPQPAPSQDIYTGWTGTPDQQPPSGSYSSAGGAGGVDNTTGDGYQSSQ